MCLALRENRKSEAVKSIVGRNTLPLQDGLWNNMNKKPPSLEIGRMLFSAKFIIVRIPKNILSH